jgi:hypothetical protein
MPAPKDPIKYKNWRQKLSVANRGKRFTPEHCKKISDAAIMRMRSPEARKKLSIANKGKIQSKEHTAKIITKKHDRTNFEIPAESFERMRVAAKKRMENPLTRDKIRNALKIRSVLNPVSEETRKRMSVSQKKRIRPIKIKPQRESKYKVATVKILVDIPKIPKVRAKRKPASLITREKLRIAHIGQTFTSETCKRMSLAQIGRPKSEMHTMKVVEAKVGGFWYGNVRYNGKKKYCELWNKDLWVRIDTFQNNRSILSKKTKIDNGGRALTRHHVYWQERACCEWSEDDHGYYAMINIGTAKKPNMYRHYVGEDPNKFVLLTAKEHGEVAKDKLTWIKKFEKIIDEDYWGKCFYTKEEYAQLNK